VARGKQQTTRGSLLELVMIVAVALGLALGIQAFLVKPFRIPSQSMEPTLDVGQRVLVNRVTKHFSDYDRGDILVFKPPVGADEQRCGVPNDSNRRPCPRPTAQRSNTNFIKRVVAVGGDQLYVRAGRVLLKRPGQQTFRPEARGDIRFDASCEICNEREPITVPKGYYFMMGDNRGESDDSRQWGPVPKKWVIGQAFATYWPPGRIGTL
jgi:signal peptidase I